MTGDLNTILARLRSEGVRVPDAAVASVRNQLAEYGDSLDQRTREQLLQKFLDGLKSIIKPQQVLREGATQTVTEGATPTSLTGDITKLLSQFADGDAVAQALNLPFKINTAVKIMRGAANFIRMNADLLQVDAFPALALTRDYPRDVPRGFERGPKGTLIEVPDDDWPSRWADAGAASADDDWLPWEGDDQTGRGVALKSSDIWNQLGDVRDDSLGNSFPPFAFNSGFGTYEVDYKEAVALGLLDDGDKPEAASLDWTELFAPLTT